MDIKFIVDRNNDEKFNMYLVPGLKRIGVQVVQVADDETVKTLTHKYHVGRKVLIDNDMIKEDDIVVFSKEDISIVDNEFKQKVQYLFEQKTDVGVVGVLGAEQINEEGFWSDAENNPIGHIIKGLSSGKGQGEPHAIGPVGYYDDAVMVDSNFFMIRASLLNEIDFDTDTLKGDNHLCAMDLCMQVLKRGYKISVADILIYQESFGHFSTSDSYKESKKLFDAKYKDIGFPITINSFEFDRPEIVEVEI